MQACWVMSRSEPMVTSSVVCNARVLRAAGPALVRKESLHVKSLLSVFLGRSSPSQEAERYPGKRQQDNASHIF